MADLKDYSGPLKLDLKLEDFSKEFLVKLAKEWQGACLRLDEIFFNLVKERLGQQAADEIELETWAKLAKVNVPRIAKLANIQVRDIVDYQKLSQLLVEGLFFQPTTDVEIISRDHVKLTVHRCLNLEYFEKHDPSRIIPICHKLEVAMFSEYIHVLLPDAKVNCLKLPPRKSPAEIACQWEYIRAR